jgi:hypothetical protein
MTDLAQWEKENADFLTKIGQVSSVPAAPKPTTKKDEE